VGCHRGSRLAVHPIQPLAMYRVFLTSRDLVHMRTISFQQGMEPHRVLWSLGAYFNTLDLESCFATKRDVMMAIRISLIEPLSRNITNSPSGAPSATFVRSEVSPGKDDHQAKKVLYM
jgi:hypothetical protein